MTGGHRIQKQIITVLREHEAGAKAGDLARKHGVSEATLYNWKAKYGGMDVSDAKRLKALEDENAKLKKLWPAAGFVDTEIRCLTESESGNATKEVQPRVQA